MKKQIKKIAALDFWSLPLIPYSIRLAATSEGSVTLAEEFKDDLLVSQCGLLNQRRSQSIKSAFLK